MIKRLFVSIILLFSAVITMAANIKIQNWQADNGAEVYFVKTPALPMADIRVVFAAGSAYDGEHWGLASFVNNMLGLETQTKSANDIANEFDSVGADYGTNIGRDMSTVSLRTLTNSKYLKPALATFEDVLTRAKFDENAYNLVLNQTLASIKVNQESPDSVALNTFNKALYGDQPYGHPILGTMDSIKQLTLAEIKAFYQHYYVAKNADIIMVGDLSNSQAKSIANQISKALPAGEHAKTLDMMKSAAEDKAIHVNFPSQQTAIMLGQLGITRKNSAYFPLVVGNSILGQLPLTSILFQNVRNTRGLAYYASSSFDLLQYKGPFEVGLKTRAAKTQEAVSVVKSTLDDYIKNGPTSAQLKIAKDYLSGSFPLATATNSSILNSVTNIAFYHRPLDFLDTYLKNVDAVTVNQIKSAFQKTLHPKSMILVTVGPNEAK
jgi:zinc protease